MADVVSRATRSRMMSGIRGTNTRPERLVRSGLWREGFRFRLHVRSLPGHPDIVLPRWRTVVQVHGCFWHGHTNCRFFRLPQVRRQFWKDKIATNRRRDRKTQEDLLRRGWRYMVVWECALRDNPARAGNLLCQVIRSPKTCAEIASDSGVIRIQSRR